MRAGAAREPGIARRLAAQPPQHRADERVEHDQRRRREAGHAHDGLAARAREQRRLPGPDVDAVEQDAGRFEIGERVGGQVLGPDRGPAREDHRVVPVERARDRPPQRRRVVGDDAGERDVAAGGGHLCAERGLVGVAHLARAGRLGRIAQLVAGGHHGDAGAPVDVDGRDPERRQHRQILGAEAPAGGQHGGAAREILAALDDVGARRRPRARARRARRRPATRRARS